MNGSRKTTRIGKVRQRTGIKSLAELERGDFVLVSDRDLVDISGPKIVSIRVREDRRVVWVNVNGKCLLRCCNVGEVEITGAKKTVKKKK